MGRELTGTGGGETRPGRLAGTGGGFVEPSKRVLGLTKAERGGGRRRGPVGCTSPSCAGSGVFEAGREGSRGGRLGRLEGSGRGTAEADSPETGGEEVASACSRSAASLAACASLSRLDGGSGGSFAGSKAGAITRRAAGESIVEAVLARDNDRFEIDEMWETSDELEPRLDTRGCAGLRGGKVGVGVGFNSDVFREGSGGRPGRAGGVSAGAVAGEAIGVFARWGILGGSLLAGRAGKTGVVSTTS